MQVYLLRALETNGCPLCNVVARAAEKHIFWFLWEKVNDPDLRVRLVNSRGYCRTHAIQMVRMEKQEWHDMLGTATVYESILSRVLADLKEESRCLERPHSPPPRATPWGSLIRRVRGAAVPRARPNARGDSVPYPQPATCPVCESVRRSEEAYAECLCRSLDEPRIASAFANSEGLCLPHLSLVGQVCRESEPLRRIIDHTAQRVEALSRLVSEYGRKHCWQYRDEPVTADETASCERSIAFFVGEDESLVGFLPSKEKAGNR